RQALVTTDMVVCAHVFVAGTADQQRSRYQFKGAAGALAAEAALTHVGERERAMRLREWPLARRRIAPVVDHRHRISLQKCRCGHDGNLEIAPEAGNVPGAAP